MERKKIIAKIHEYERHINTQKQRIEVSKNVIERYSKLIEELKNELR